MTPPSPYPLPTWMIKCELDASEIDLKFNAVTATEVSLDNPNNPTQIILPDLSAVTNYATYSFTFTVYGIAGDDTTELVSWTLELKIDAPSGSSLQSLAFNIPTDIVTVSTSDGVTSKPILPTLTMTPAAPVPTPPLIWGVERVPSTGPSLEFNGVTAPDKIAVNSSSAATHIQIPDLSNATSGDYDFIVKVVSGNDPTKFATYTLTVRVTTQATCASATIASNSGPSSSPIEHYYVGSGVSSTWTFTSAPTGCAFTITCDFASLVANCGSS